MLGPGWRGLGFWRLEAIRIWRGSTEAYTACYRNPTEGPRKGNLGPGEVHHHHLRSTLVRAATYCHLGAFPAVPCNHNLNHPEYSHTYGDLYETNKVKYLNVPKGCHLLLRNRTPPKRRKLPPNPPNPFTLSKPGH